MKKKSMKLPVNFMYIMKRGDFEELKSVYEECDIKAHRGTKNDTWDLPFQMDTPCIEFYQWLVEQGLDVNVEDSYGKTALHNANTARQVEGLVLAGANLEAREGVDMNTPLHTAMRYANVQVAKQLIKMGADINATNGMKKTPLDWLFMSARYSNVDRVCDIVEYALPLNANIYIDVKTKLLEWKEDIGRLNGSNPTNDISMLSEKLNKLCDLLHVELPDMKFGHEGMTELNIQSTEYDKIVDEVWNLLVPKNGYCDTVQGEAIRICFKVQDWIIYNNGLKWRDDYKEMLAFLPELFLKAPNVDTDELNKIKVLIKKISYNESFKEINELCHYSIKWLKDNLKLIQLESVPYQI